MTSGLTAEALAIMADEMEGAQASTSESLPSLYGQLGKVLSDTDSDNHHIVWGKIEASTDDGSDADSDNDALRTDSFEDVTFHESLSEDEQEDTEPVATPQGQMRALRALMQCVDNGGCDDYLAAPVKTQSPMTTSIINAMNAQKEKAEEVQLIGLLGNRPIPFKRPCKYMRDRYHELKVKYHEMILRDPDGFDLNKLHLPAFVEANGVAKAKLLCQLHIVAQKEKAKMQMSCLP